LLRSDADNVGVLSDVVDVVDVDDDGGAEEVSTLWLWFVSVAMCRFAAKKDGGDDGGDGDDGDGDRGDELLGVSGAAAMCANERIANDKRQKAKAKRRTTDDAPRTTDDGRRTSDDDQGCSSFFRSSAASWKPVLAAGTPA